MRSVPTWDPGDLPDDFEEPEVDDVPHARSRAEAAKPPEADRSIVVDLIRPRQLVLFASEEGIGKSYARLELAVRLATGTGALFGHYAIVEPTRVLLVDEENGEPEEWRREEEILGKLDLPRTALAGYATVHYAGMDLLDPARRAWLEGETAVTGAQVLILDTGGAMIADEWGAPLKAAIRYLRNLIRRTGLAVVVVVHMTKPPRDKPTNGQAPRKRLSDVLGNWTRHADVVAMMTDLGADRARFEVRKRVAPSSLVLAQDGGLWQTVAIGESEREPGGEDRVLRAIGAGAATWQALSTALGMSRSQVFEHVRRLRSSGLVKDASPYELTPEGWEAVE